MTAAKALLANPRILQALKTTLGVGAGAGVGALENKFVYDPMARAITGDSTATASPLASNMSILLGALTGGLGARPGGLVKQLGAYVPKVTALSGVEALNQGTKAYIADAPLRKQIADTNAGTAKTELETAKNNLTSSQEWSPAAKALAVLAGAGVLGAGVYAGKSLLGGKKPGKPGTPTVGKGDEAQRRKQKVRIDVPVGALPPEFFNSLATVDQPDEKPQTKAARELRQDLAVLKSAAAYDGYAGLGMQSYLPIQKRRKLTGDEEEEFAHAEGRVFPKIFPSDADPLTADVSSPWTRAALLGLLGAGAGGALGSAGNGTTAMLAAMLGGGALGTVGYLSSKAENDTIRDRMTRLPRGATRRDMKADPVYQAEEERAARIQAARLAALTNR